MQLTYQQRTSIKTAEIIEQPGVVTGVMCRWQRGTAPRICAIARLPRIIMRAAAKRKGRRTSCNPPLIEGDQQTLKPVLKSTAQLLCVAQELCESQI
jgi:hypothetical protein